MAEPLNRASTLGSGSVESVLPRPLLSALLVHVVDQRSKPAVVGGELAAEPHLLDVSLHLVRYVAQNTERCRFRAPETGQSADYERQGMTGE